MKLSDYINLTLVEIAKGAQKATESYQEITFDIPVLLPSEMR